MFYSFNSSELSSVFLKPLIMYDVIIIGSGPAGLTAAIYTTRANLKTLVIAGSVWGGQLMLTTLVENYPGFPEGIMGPDLMMAMKKQAEHHGAQILDVNFAKGDFTKQPFQVGTDDEKTFEGRSIIIATGADTKWLSVAGEKERIGRGVSSCAPCDAPFFKEKRVMVVGGGDSAIEEALVLTRFTDHVWMVHRRDSLRASDIMQKRAFDNKKITFIWNTEVLEVMGEGKVERVKLKSIPPRRDKNQNTSAPIGATKIQIKNQNQDKEALPEELGGKRLTNQVPNNEELLWEFPIEGVFVAIGHMPNSSVFVGVETDEAGFIKIFDHTKTNVAGVFVAGDVHDAHYKQAVTAAGFGCMAALDVEKWLEEKHT